MKYECQNCDWTGPLAALAEIKDFHERVDPGEECPAGECPKCGALCHESTYHRQWMVIFHHEHGVNVGIVRAEEEPSDVEACKALEWDYEGESKGEEVEICLITESEIPTIRTEPTGQDRESYSDEQDRESYKVDATLKNKCPRLIRKLEADLRESIKTSDKLRDLINRTKKLKASIPKNNC